MKVLKGFVILSVIVLSLIVIIGSCSDTEVAPVEDGEYVFPAEVQQIIDDHQKKIEETDFAAAFEQTVLEMLQENYAGIGVVELNREDKTFFITPGEEVIPDLIAAQAGDPEAVQAWNEAVEAFISFSRIISPQLPGYVLAIRNPADPDKMILAVLDSTVIYDFTND